MLDAFLHNKNFENRRACNFFAVWLRMLFFFLEIDVYIQLILEFKNSIGKNCPFFPKSHKNLFLAGCFFRQAVLQKFKGW